MKSNKIVLIIADGLTFNVILSISKKKLMSILVALMHPVICQSWKGFLVLYNYKLIIFDMYCSSYLAKCVRSSLI